ncbi:MAG: T9SS type A sorting domain-containing protein [Lewinellaceae bacterium]|nr:T9SS type A sorting domain-containing protein [Lewinellaceae bacterium]
MDATFSDDGKYLKVLGNNTQGSAWSTALAIDSQGNYYLGGYAPTPLSMAFTVVSVRSNGVINGSFGSFGLKQFNLAPFAAVNDILFQPDGKLLCGGYAFYADTATAFVHMRLLPNGNPDLSFGGQNGAFISILSDGFNTRVISDLAFQADGKLLTLGWQNQTVMLGLGERAKAVVFRGIMDFLVSSLKTDANISSVTLYPNPVRDEPVTLNYTLTASDRVSISVFDAGGTKILSVFQSESRSAGAQQEQFNLPAGLPSGIYYLLLEGHAGFQSFKIVKQ